MRFRQRELWLRDISFICTTLPLAAVVYWKVRQTEERMGLQLPEWGTGYHAVKMAILTASSVALDGLKRMGALLQAVWTVSAVVPVMQKSSHR